MVDTFNDMPYDDDGFDWELSSQDGQHEHYAHVAGQDVNISHSHSMVPYQPHVHPEFEKLITVLLSSAPETVGRPQPLVEPTDKPF